MVENIETLATHPEIVKRLQSAFPTYLSKEVEATVSILPVHRIKPTQHNIGSIVLSGESIHIPSRFYSSEPIESSLTGFSKLNHTILACVYTRHHDGFVRLKYVEQLFSQNEIWVSPFVIQLLGEYVVEIIEVISQNISLIQIELYKEFLKDNSTFAHLLKQRIVSYWACYYRWKSPHFKDYVGFQIADTFGLWNKNDVRHLLAR